MQRLFMLLVAGVTLALAGWVVKAAIADEDHVDEQAEAAEVGLEDELGFTGIISGEALVPVAEGIKLWDAQTQARYQKIQKQIKRLEREARKLTNGGKHDRAKDLRKKIDLLKKWKPSGGNDAPAVFYFGTVKEDQPGKDAGVAAEQIKIRRVAPDKADTILVKPGDDDGLVEGEIEIQIQKPGKSDVAEAELSPDELLEDEAEVIFQPIESLKGQPVEIKYLQRNPKQSQIEVELHDVELMHVGPQDRILVEKLSGDDAMRHALEELLKNLDREADELAEQGKAKEAEQPRRLYQELQQLLGEISRHEGRKFRRRQQLYNRLKEAQRRKGFIETLNDIDLMNNRFKRDEEGEQDLTRKIERLNQAAEQLRDAGLRPEADELQKKAEQIQLELHQRQADDKIRRARGWLERHRQEREDHKPRNPQQDIRELLHDLRQEVRELREEVHELHEFIEDRLEDDDEDDE